MLQRFTDHSQLSEVKSKYLLSDSGVLLARVVAHHELSIMVHIIKHVFQIPIRIRLDCFFLSHVFRNYEELVQANHYFGFHFFKQSLSLVSNNLTLFSLGSC